MNPILYSPHSNFIICLLEKPGLSGVYVNGWVTMGSKDDPSELPGLAHLLEHFRVDEVAHSRRHLLSDVRYSAWTDKEYTYYGIQSRAAYLEKSLAVLETCFSPLSVSPVQMKESLQHIASEVRQNSRDPWLQLHRQWNQLVFTNPAYARSTWGNPNALAVQSAKYLEELGNSKYKSAAKSVLIVGSRLSDVEQMVISWAQKVALHASNTETMDIPGASFNKIHLNTVQDTESSSHSLKYLAWGFRLPIQLRSKKYLIDLLECILAVGWDARLAELYQGHNRMTYSVKSSVHWYKSIGSWKMQAAFRSEDIDSAKKRIEFHYQDLANQIVLPTELNRAKDVLLTRLALRTDNPEFLARWYGGQMIHGASKLHTLAEYEKKVCEATAEELHACMQMIITKKISVVM